MNMTEPKVITISEKRPFQYQSSWNKPKTKFLVYSRGDKVIMKKIELPDLKKEWDDIFEMMDKKKLKISDKETQKEVAEARKN